VHDEGWGLCFLVTTFRKRSYRRACGVYSIMDNLVFKLSPCSKCNLFLFW